MQLACLFYFKLQTCVTAKIGCWSESDFQNPLYMNVCLWTVLYMGLCVVYVLEYLACMIFRGVPAHPSCLKLETFIIFNFLQIFKKLKIIKVSSLRHVL